MTKSILAASVSLVALAAGSAALAQTSADPAMANVEGVVVTGSRTVTTGNSAPTPVTVVSAEKLMATTPSTLADAVVRLPAFAPGNDGMKFLDAIPSRG